MYKLHFISSHFCFLKRPLAAAISDVTDSKCFVYKNSFFIGDINHEKVYGK